MGDSDFQRNGGARRLQLVDARGEVDGPIVASGAGARHLPSLALFTPIMYVLFGWCQSAESTSSGAPLLEVRDDVERDNAHPTLGSDHLPRNLDHHTFPAAVDLKHGDSTV